MGGVDLTGIYRRCSFKSAYRQSHNCCITKHYLAPLIRQITAMANKKYTRRTILQLVQPWQFKTAEIIVYSQISWQREILYKATDLIGK